MDLLSTVRKSGSRGGVNFSWDEVASSSHRENYLGHSLKAPVGRWQQGRDLNWYAKSDSDGKGGVPGETDEERQQRERKEELRRVKEAEEDAMAAALGLPPPQRNTSGANAIEVQGDKTAKPADLPTVVAEKGKQDEEASRHRRSRRHDDHERRDRDGNHRHRHHRHRSRSRSRSQSRRERHERHRHGEGNREDRHRHREGSRDGRHRDERPRRRERSRERDEHRRQGHRASDGANRDERGRPAGTRDTARHDQGHWRARSKERVRKDRSRSPRASQE